MAVFLPQLLLAPCRDLLELLYAAELISWSMCHQAQLGRVHMPAAVEVGG